MSYFLLLHWNAEEAEERARRLQGWGHKIRILSGGDAKSLRPFVQDPPEAAIIDLGRLPAQGREIGTYLRRRKSTRRVPLVFVGGQDEKVAKTRQMLPDAIYAAWPDLEATLTEVLASGPLEADPIVPSAMGAYSGTPLPKKLGIRAGDDVSLLGAPNHLESILQPLPDGAVLRRRGGSATRIVLLFVHQKRELDKRFPKALQSMQEGGSIWIAWPKKASGLSSDLTQQIIRNYGLDRGLVDYKIASIDATWSGLRFARRAS